MTPPLQRGEIVTITTETGREVPATVQVASPNGRSLMLAFDAMIGGWVQQLPAFEDDDGRWTALDGMPITIRRQTAEDHESRE